MARKGTYTYEWPRPMVTVDAIVYAVVDGRISLVLIRRKSDPFKGLWAFPGGFIEMDEELDDAVRRELREETGLSGIDLRQMYTFGTVGRDPRGRQITVAFLGRARPDQMALSPGDDAAEAWWFDAERLPALAFDHDHVARMAIARIRESIDAMPDLRE